MMHGTAWIDQQNVLVEFCNKLTLAAAQAPIVIAIDTEFIRETTYWPQLCLIQIATAEEVVLIDALAKGLDLFPLAHILSHPRITKVFHAARQDIEIFWYLLQEVPAPFWDTQVAAMACGYGDSIAYSALVQDIVGCSIDKSARFTDWAKRPLTDKQIRYAAQDVLFLIPVYQNLHKRLDDLGRSQWIQEELQDVVESVSSHNPREQIWSKIAPNGFKPKHLVVLKCLTEERERIAMEMNVPRSRVVKDGWLIEMALQQPLSPHEFMQVRGLTSSFCQSPLALRLIESIKGAHALPKSEWPTRSAHSSFPQKYEGIVDILRLLLKYIAEQHHLAPKLIATRQDLEQLLLAHEQHSSLEHNLLKGWRYDLYGCHAMDIIKGNKALAWKGDQLILV